MYSNYTVFSSILWFSLAKVAPFLLQLLVDVFSPVFRTPKNRHLQNFYMVVPPLVSWKNPAWYFNPSLILKSIPWKYPKNLIKNSFLCCKGAYPLAIYLFYRKCLPFIELNPSEKISSLLSVDYELCRVSHECQGQDEQEEQAGSSLHWWWLCHGWAGHWIHSFTTVSLTLK